MLEIKISISVVLGVCHHCHLPIHHFLTLVIQLHVKKEEEDKIGRGEDTGGLRATFPSIISLAQTLEEQEKEKAKSHTNCFHRMILCFLPRFLKQSTKHNHILNCTVARPGIPPILFLILHSQKSLSFLPASPFLPPAWSADRHGGGLERKRGGRKKGVQDRTGTLV